MSTWITRSPTRAIAVAESGRTINVCRSASGPSVSRTAATTGTRLRLSNSVPPPGGTVASSPKPYTFVWSAGPTARIASYAPNEPANAASEHDEDRRRAHQ